MKKLEHEQIRCVRSKNRQMNSQQKLNIVFSIIVIALIFTIVYLSLSKNNAVNEQSDLDKSTKHQLIEVHNEKDLIITGIIKPSLVEEVQLKVNGKIDKDNRTLAVGSRFKKNEILVKVERLEALYGLLSARSEFKGLIQKMILTINDNFPSESNKWKHFENQIQRTLPLPTLPKVKTKNEEELLNSLSIYSQYYNTKKLERKAEDYIYIAPFDGTILESSVRAGSNISEGKTILKLAKNNSLYVISHISLNDIDRIKKSDTVYVKSREGNTLARGMFLKTGTHLSDSSTMEVYYSIYSQEQNLLNQFAYISIEGSPTTIPTSAIKNDSIEIYSHNKPFKLKVKTIASNGDSSIVEDLPQHSFINVNP